MCTIFVCSSFGAFDNLVHIVDFLKDESIVVDLQINQIVRHLVYKN